MLATLPLPDLLLSLCYKSPSINYDSVTQELLIRVTQLGDYLAE